MTQPFPPYLSGIDVIPISSGIDEYITLVPPKYQEV